MFWLSLIKFFNILTVVAFMNVKLPLKPGSKDLQARWDVATGIVQASDSPDDWALLVGIARWESVYRPEVFDCRVKSSIGAAGAFQVLPRSMKEQHDLCTDYAESARLALVRVKESQSICRHLPKREQLSQYVTGNCTSTEGKMHSRLRYATGQEMIDAVNKARP